MQNNVSYIKKTMKILLFLFMFIAISVYNSMATVTVSFPAGRPPVLGIDNNKVAIIEFIVTDVDGNPVIDGTAIDVCMFGPSGGRLSSKGGEYITETYTTEADDVIEAYTDANGNGCYDTGESYTDSNGNGVYDSFLHVTVFTADGKALAFPHSGLVGGNVTLRATEVDTGLSSSTPTLSIGGGVAADDHFLITTDTLNLPGLEEFGREATISISLADRFGNTNVLNGNALSFWNESGATISSAFLDAKGKASVVWRTQNPLPGDVAVVTGSWEDAFLNYVLTQYGIDDSGNPRDGWATITVGTYGEEAFDDASGTGMYDAGEDFTDTPNELFVDSNDNETHDYGPDPFERYQDNNPGNGRWDGVNGQWDAFKTIFKHFKLLVTGSPRYMRLSAKDQITDCSDPTNPDNIREGYTPVQNDDFTICNGESRSFKLFVSDMNLNAISPGSTIKVEVSGDGRLEGTTNIIMPDVFATGTELEFTLTDDNANETYPPRTVYILITVEWVRGPYYASIWGKID